MNGARLSRAALSIILVLSAGALLSGCTQKTADPWINEGQQERLAGQQDRDQETAEHLRDRMRSGQAQR